MADGDDQHGADAHISDDDFGLGSDYEGQEMNLTDLLDIKLAKEDAPKQANENTPKIDVTARAKVLGKRGKTRKHFENDELAPLAFSESEQENEEDDDDAALDKVTLAATGRDFSARRERKKALDVQLGVGKEDTFAAPVSNNRSGREVLDKMLTVLQGDEEAEDAIRNLGALKKRVAAMERGGRKPLAAPLPDVVAGRLERVAAYKKTNQEVTEKWSKVVQDNRKLRTLKLPLGLQTKPVYSSTADAVRTFQPGNEFEREIEELLKEGGVTGEVDVMKREEEDLKAAKISKEEVIARRRELAKMRSLAFEYERKMKRIAKIKSKKFRKIMKHEKLKLKKEMGEDVEDVVEERLEAERKRAEERMTLRHKNTSKWIKRQLQRGGQKKNLETRVAIEEQLRTHEELKKRQESVEDLDGSESDSEVDRIGSDVEDLNMALDGMRKDLENTESGKKKKGIAGMKFMQVAAERERKQALELLKEMGSDEEEGLDEYGSEGEKQQIVVGRVRFSGLKGDMKVKEKEGEDEVRKEYENDAKGEGAGVQVHSGDVERLVREVNDTSKGFVTKLDGKISAEAPDNGEKANVLVASDGIEGQSIVEQRIFELSDNEEIVETPKKTSKKKNRRKSKQKETTNDGEGGDELEGTPKKKKARISNDVVTAKHNQLRTSKVASDGKTKSKTPEQMSVAKKSLEADRARMQMVARAFAGLGGADEADFEAAKQEDIEKDIDAETKAAGTQVLPGWGSWGGAGMKKRRKKSAFAEAAEKKLAEARANAVRKRADKNEAHLQLSARRAKGARALTIANTPFPFRSPKEWAKELDTPRVKELTAGRVYRSAIKERVETQKGVPILPIQFDGNRMEKREVKVGRVAKGRRGVLERRQKASKARERKRRGFMA